MIKQVHFASLLLNLLPYYRDFMKSTVKFAEMKKKLPFFIILLDRFKNFIKNLYFQGDKLDSSFWHGHVDIYSVICLSHFPLNFILALRVKAQT